MYAQTVNSYSRLVPGYWAPLDATWGMENRTTALRLIPGSDKSQRVEVRIGSADANPYVALAAALGSGLHGIVLKDGAEDSLLDCLEAVAAGRRAVSPELLQRALDLSLAESRPNPLDALAPRERAIVEQVGRGLRNREIGAALGMTEGTVKVYLHAIYQKLGQTEIDDMAAGVKALAARPYVDGARVGIFGTSYGGYASAMALLRHPEAFAAASAMSPVTDWRNYDTIYTERYMWTPAGNKAGYDAGAAVTYADSLRGRLMLYYGTADNNVHPSNTLQLVSALQRAGKSFDIQVGPDRGHTALNSALGMANVTYEVTLKILAPGFAEAVLLLGLGLFAGAVAVIGHWALEARIDRDVLEG